MNNARLLLYKVDNVCRDDTLTLRVLDGDILEGNVLGIMHLAALISYEEGIAHLQVLKGHFGQTIEPDGTLGTLADDIRDIKVAEARSLLSNWRNGIFS